MVSTEEKSQSEGGKSMGYQQVQSNPSETIYNGQAPLGAVDSTVAPPIYLFYPIFDHFETCMNNPSLQLMKDDLINMKRLMQETSILFSSKKEFSSAIDPLLETLLGHQFIKGKNIGDRVNADNEDCLFLVEEIRLMISEGGCDPSPQVCIHMR